MNPISDLQTYLGVYAAPLSLPDFIINIVLTGLLSFTLGLLFIRFGGTISNRKKFARTFTMTAMTTMFIITVVKSSLALSLGLVGALSIVRFRAAIKEPEELSYLFLCIAIGLGFGAGQRGITVIAFAIICLVIVSKRFFQTSVENNQNLFLTVTSNQTNELALGDIVDVLEQQCSRVSVKRFDEGNSFLEASFLVEFTDFKKLQTATAELKAMEGIEKVTYFDNQDLVP